MKGASTLFDKINRRRFLVNTFATGYPEIHKKEYDMFLKSVPEQQRKAYYGSEDLEYIKFLQQRNIPEFLTMVNSQLQGIAL